MPDILYRPNLDYDKNYNTDGVISQITEQDSVQSDNTGLPDLKERLDRIELLLPLLPYDIAKMLSTPIRGARYIYNQINPDNYDPDFVNSATKIIFTRPDPIDVPDPVDTDSDGPDSIFSSSIPIIDVQIIKSDPVEAIKKEYDNTLAAILSDYINSLQEKFNKYFSNMGTHATEAGVTVASLSSKYESNTTDIKNTNLYHVSDSIIRSQIVRDQKIRMYRKLYSQEETVSHIKACVVAKDLRIRYYEEERVATNSFLDLAKNVMLADAKQIYDKKYKENLYNLYKYLNSSVILIDECLMMFIKESQAKMILIKEEGLKL